jgi:hypothetical protein
VEKADYIGFATFMGHLHEWGFKVILTKACSTADFLAYARSIILIAEEHGGVRTAYQYDVLQRRAMARALERDEVDLTPYFTKIDRDVLKDAKDKVEKHFAEIARASAPKGQAKGQPKGPQKGFDDNAASSSNKGGKGGKKNRDGADASDRRVKSPTKRPRGSADSGQQTRSRSPRAASQQCNSGGNKW